MSTKTTKPAYTHTWLQQYIQNAMSILGNENKREQREFSTLEDRMRFIKSILKRKSCPALGNGHRFGEFGLWADNIRNPDLKKLVPGGMLMTLAKEHERKYAKKEPNNKNTSMPTNGDLQNDQFLELRREQSQPVSPSKSDDNGPSDTDDTLLKQEVSTGNDKMSGQPRESPQTQCPPNATIRRICPNCMLDALPAGIDGLRETSAHLINIDPKPGPRTTLPRSPYVGLRGQSQCVQASTTKRGFEDGPSAEDHATSSQSDHSELDNSPIRKKTCTEKACKKVRV